MKFINVRSIEIFTDGTFSFSYKGLKFLKQVVTYEKDAQNFSFFKKSTKKQLFQNLSRNSYKSKYKL